LPGLTVPSGLSNGMPTGIQFIAQHLDEQKVLDLGYTVEKELGRLILDI
jgi:Asp-tRNA(Asn)/Glu-tRNA(Gln) amidotransferase A subunit family amidase